MDAAIEEAFALGSENGDEFLKKQHRYIRLVVSLKFLYTYTYIPSVAGRWY